MNIYVGNLSYDVTGDNLQQAFKVFGQVTSATIIMDKFTGKSRGFGFVEMPVEEEAKAAIAGMNNKELGGRTLSVNEARPRSEGGRGGGKSFGNEKSFGGGKNFGGGRNFGGGYGDGERRDNRRGDRRGDTGRGDTGRGDSGRRGRRDGSSESGRRRSW